MHANVTETGGTVVPTLRYRDVAAAIDWLCNAFGFQKHHVVSGDDGAVRYAELTFGNGMIMLGPVEGSGLDRFMAQPADIGGAETQICYLFVGDATAHCAQAKAAGAEIVLDIEDADSNGRGYSCRDLEGHIWNFGTYDPWKRQPAPAGGKSGYSTGLRRGLRRLTVVAALLAVVVASAALVGLALGVGDVSLLELRTAASAGTAEASAGAQQNPLVRERDAREVADRAAKEAREQLARERGERAETERALEDARQQLVRQRSALEAAERVTQEARERLSLAERAGQSVQEQLAAERSARETTEHAAQQARQQLAKEQGAKDAAERAAKEAREQEAKERAARRPPPRPRPLQPWQSGRMPFVNWDQ